MNIQATYRLAFNDFAWSVINIDNPVKKLSIRYIINILP